MAFLFIVIAIVALVVSFNTSTKDRGKENEPEQNASKQYGSGFSTTARPSAMPSGPSQSKDRVIPHHKTPAALLPGIDRETFDSELSVIPLSPLTLSEQPVDRHMLENMREIRITNITRQTNMQKLFPIVVLDTETTGLSPSSDDIIELSAIKYEAGFTPVSCFNCLLKPRKKIPVSASKVNNISDEMVKDSPSFQYVSDCFSDFIAGCNIVGHNLIFDLKFLYASGMELPNKVRYYDTYKLARNTLVSFQNRVYDHRTGRYLSAEESGVNVDDFKLVTLCDYYNIHRGTVHRALSDCHATAKVFERLISDKTQPIE